MKKIYVTNIAKYIRKKFILIILFEFICMFLFLYFAKIKIEENRQIAIPKYSLEMEQYEAKLQEYDQVLDDLKLSIENAQKMADEKQKYINNSIYMQLDSQNICVSNIQYVISNCNNVSNVLNSLVTYITSGSLRYEMAEKYPEVPEEYLKELITSSTSGNILSVSIMHYDAEETEKLMSLIDQLLQEYVGQIASVQEPCTMEKINSSNSVVADASVMNSQSTNLYNLRNDLSSLSDLEKKLIDQESNKQAYIDKYMPELVMLNEKKILLYHAIAGILIGLLIVFSVVVIIVLLQDYIRDKKDLHNLGINVLDSINIEKKNDASICISDDFFEMITSLNNIKSVYFSVIGQNVIFPKHLNNKTNIETVVGLNTMDNYDDLKKMIYAKNCVLVVQIGVSAYTDIQEHLNLCQKFDIPVLGCIVIE